MQVQERTSSVGVEAGLHVLRYSPTSRSHPPHVFVRPSIGNEAALRLIAAPGRQEASLGPGDVMVVVAERRATLQITARASIAGGPLDAELRLEPLQRVASSAPQTSAAKPPSAAAPVGPLLLAHVARRGDLRLAMGDWVCGPDAPAPIEGLQVSGLLGAALEMRVWIAGDAQWSAWRNAADFAGSRGRARPLVGVQLRLVGASAQDFRIEAEALFLGSALMRKSGADVEFRSAAGRDPLVGFRLKVAEGLHATTPEIRTPEPQIGASRVRVFRPQRERRVA